MTAPTELLPCPFCGSRNVAQGASSDRISVWCGCGARGPDVAFPQDCIDPVTPIKECHGLWNRRDPASEAGWRPIDTAPHNQAVILGWHDWRDGQWCLEIGSASTGQRFDNGYSSVSRHGSAKYWLPLDRLPSAPDRRA